MPHTKTFIPDNMGEILVSKEELFEFSNLISDLRIDDLFDHGIGEKYIAPYSRVFCDVEKFIDDSFEVMSKYGQGVFLRETQKEKEYVKYLKNTNRKSSIIIIFLTIKD